tara:strand:+ start:3796 stop:5253 length:1458 start_codon:yes stop_codon:yes gene_type:complete
MSKNQSAPMPEVLRPSALQRPANQRLTTTILYPVVANQKQLVFNFNRTGILDRNSRLNLQLLVSLDGTGTYPYAPSNSGCASWVKRAYLSIGGRMVSNLSDANHYMTYDRLHHSNCYRDGIMLNTQGGNDTFVGSNEAAYPKTANWGTLGRRDPSQEHQVIAATTLTNPIAGLSNTGDSAPEYSMPLAQFIPLLRNMQLPLFALNQDVSLTIELAGTGKNAGDVGVRYVNNGGDPTTAGATSSFNLPACYIMMDTLYYPNKMSEIADDMNSRGGYNVSFDEILTQVDNETWTAETPSTQQHQIQVAGKKVKNLIFQNSSLVKNQGGIFNSQALVRGVEYNATIDSVPVYTEGLSNAALQFSETDTLERLHLRCPLWRYCMANQTNFAQTGLPGVNCGFTDREFNEYSQEEEQGSQYWTGIKLENAQGEGRVMSSLPIVLTRKVQPQIVDVNPGGAAGNTKVNNLRTFITTQRRLNMNRAGTTLLE